MKKNALLGVFALLFAVGTAFATTQLAPPRTVYFWDNESTRTNCLNEIINTECEVIGDENCREETSQTSGDRQLYDKPGCLDPLDREAGF